MTPPAPTTVTITIRDNPLRLMPGQPDIQIEVSSEPDLELPEGGLPSADDVPLPLLAAIEMLAHVGGMAHETVLYTIARGETIGGQGSIGGQG